MPDMTESYSEFVARLLQPGEAILANLTPKDANLLHLAVLLAGEAGELVDAIKKATIYRRELDMENVVEELGDLEFTLEGIRAALGISRDVALAANRQKLSVRFPDGYSNAAASARLDKQDKLPE